MQFTKTLILNSYTRLAVEKGIKSLEELTQCTLINITHMLTVTLTEIFVKISFMLQLCHQFNIRFMAENRGNKDIFVFRKYYLNTFTSIQILLSLANSTKANTFLPNSFPPVITWLVFLIQISEHHAHLEVGCRKETYVGQSITCYSRWFYNQSHFCLSVFLSSLKSFIIFRFIMPIQVSTALGKTKSSSDGAAPFMIFYTASLV